jgi:D-alanyl-D-alanine carboxypeptidase (penicillin-binding protein 5/6)
VGEVRITADAGPSNTAPLFAAENDEPGGIFAKGIDSLLIGADEIVSHALAKVLKTHT